MKDSEPAPAPKLVDWTVGELLRRTAARMPGNPAMTWGEERWSYEEMDRRVDALALRLIAWGVRRGERVALWRETDPDTLFLLFALARMGAVTVMPNTSLEPRELERLLRRSGVDFLIIGDGYKEIRYPAVCRNLRERLPKLREILYLGAEPCLPEYRDEAGWMTHAALPEALAAAEQEVRPEDTAFLLYTSGTTGRVLGVLGSHRSWTNSGIQQAADLSAGEKDRFCVAMPVFHCFGLSVNVMAACAAGACLCLPESRRTSALLKTVREQRCTILSCVPALYRAMLSRPDFADWDLSSLRTGFIGGSLCPPALFCQIEEAFHFTLLSSLGQTEATAGITAASPEDTLKVRAETVGRFMARLEGGIFDPESGRALAAGRSGEIRVRGYGVMQGYEGMPEETAKTVDGDGWLCTGDLGWQDEAGNIHLAGRLKELIIRGGENISPAELEAVLGEDPGILACKAVGVPDDHYGEEVCLCVELRRGETRMQEDILARLRGRVAYFKLPRYLLFFDALPRTATGKIKPRETAALARERLGLSGPDCENK